MRRMIGILCAALVMAATGCAGTSKPFQYAAHEGGAFLADTTTQYVQKDASIAPEVKSARLADSNKLADATKDTASIDFQTVSDAWAAVKPVFFEYTNADKGLDLRPVVGKPSLREIIQMPAKKMDDAIAAEGERRGKWHPFGG